MEFSILNDLFLIAIICGITTTFVVSAINMFITKATPRIILPIVAAVITFAVVHFGSGNTIQEIQTYILKLLLTMSFSVLFYTYIGKWFVDNLFNELKTVIVSKLISFVDNNKNLTQNANLTVSNTNTLQGVIDTTSSSEDEKSEIASSVPCENAQGTSQEEGK